MPEIRKWWKKKETPPEVLYKFYGPERSEFFSSFRVRFSQVSALNDPFEFSSTITPETLEQAAANYARKKFGPLNVAIDGTKKIVSTIWTHPKLKHRPVIRFAVSTASLIIGPVACCVIYPFFRRHAVAVMKAAGADMAEAVLKLRDGMFLIFSTSARWDSVPMWAHYAANHSGFCVGIDPKISFLAPGKLAPKFLPPRRVEYRSKTPTARAGTFEIDDFLTCKMDHWSYEHEWRFLGLSDDAATTLREPSGRQVLLFDLNPKAIREVIFGATASYEFISSVLNCLIEQKLYPELFKISKKTGYGFQRIHLSDYLSQPVEHLNEKDVPTLSSLKLDRMEQAMRAMSAASTFSAIFGARNEEI